jgi:hypothetical protein
MFEDEICCAAVVLVDGAPAKFVSPDWVLSVELKDRILVNTLVIPDWVYPAMAHYLKCRPRIISMGDAHDR